MKLVQRGGRLAGGLAPGLTRPNTLTLASVQTYRSKSNSIADLLSASEAWHALSPERPLNDEHALRTTFDRLDLNGSGKLDAYDVKQALLQMQQMHDPFEVPDTRVDFLLLAY